MSYYSYADIDVSQWISPLRARLSFEEVCVELGINVNDPVVKYLLDIDMLAERIIDEAHLDMMGLPGDTYEAKQKQFYKLLKANPDVTYTRRNNYFVVRGWDFEMLFAQVESKQGDIFRQKSKHLQYAYRKYWEYRRLYNQHKRTNI
ncbi:hypothetical protein MdSGHV053 [Musca domestica salivary gland hypertrophy virus]|uniref:Uncharacterized protein n=1 Tax=Musca hytrovirus(isolate Musca domestica/United States/Boucias/-) TaxID=523909 RepID=B2YG30_MHVB|nr:hypothetical protein MdSGHV053 [Musca domestica salivary gland hypertrophy virus]ACD03512.1 hypothetical protein MdSGHV053 [Musca domestica salivary gland hypertrophy virus]